MAFPRVHKYYSHYAPPKFVERQKFSEKICRLSHTKREFKYHLAWKLKYWNKQLYGALKSYLAVMLRDVARMWDVKS